MAGFFPQFAFPFPPSIVFSSLLKVLPLSYTMTPPTVNVNISLPCTIGVQDEVWGMDNSDFYDGSDPLVRVVKRSGDVSCADPHVRSTFLTVVSAFAVMKKTSFKNFIKTTKHKSFMKSLRPTRFNTFLFLLFLPLMTHDAKQTQDDFINDCEQSRYGHMALWPHYKKSI